jgi:hypothetical protein
MSHAIDPPAPEARQLLAFAWIALHRETIMIHVICLSRSGDRGGAARGRWCAG